ncbi:hypothetical protein [Virgibacillus ainsalahensis]
MQFDDTTWNSFFNDEPGLFEHLGFITSTFPELEDENEVINRIIETGEYVSLNCLALSLQ